MANSDAIRILENLEQDLLDRKSTQKISRLAETLQQHAISEGTPLAEGNTAVFLYFGDAQQVGVTGAFCAGNGESIIRLRKIGGSNVWAGRAQLVEDAEFLYRLKVDGALKPDPLCRDTVVEEYAFHSVGRMPQAKPLEERLFRPDIPHGVLESFEVYSDILKGPRRVYVYLPPGYAQSRKRYPVLYLQDGDGAIKSGAYDRIVDNLVSQKAMRPIILCFIPPENRVFDYWFSGYEYAQFVARELVSHIDRRYRTRTGREDRGITGVSVGGRAALYIATNYSEMFGICIGHSVYLENNSAISERLRKCEFSPIRFYFDVGLFQKMVGFALGDGLERDVIAVNRELQGLLTQCGFEFTYREWPGDNCMLTWSRGMMEALRMFWPCQ